MTQGHNLQSYPPPSESDACLFSEDASKRPEGRVYDLAERTAKFGESVIEFLRKVPLDPVTRPLVSQLTRSGTSVGANYCEADDAVSKKEFRQKIGTCRKESKESKYWLRMMVKAVPTLRDHARILWHEAKELHLIFCAILRK
jgi:four helix bundle protein